MVYIPIRFVLCSRQSRGIEKARSGRIALCFVSWVYSRLCFLSLIRLRIKEKKKSGIPMIPAHRIVVYSQAHTKNDDQEQTDKDGDSA